MKAKFENKSVIFQLSKRLLAPGESRPWSTYNLMTWVDMGQSGQTNNIISIQSTCQPAALPSAGYNSSLAYAASTRSRRAFSAAVAAVMWTTRRQTRLQPGVERPGSTPVSGHMIIKAPGPRV
jgi:hypothetical protein